MGQHWTGFFTVYDPLSEHEEALSAFDPADPDSVARLEGARSRVALWLIRHDWPAYEPEIDGGELLRETLANLFRTSVRDL